MQAIHINSTGKYGQMLLIEVYRNKTESRNNCKQLRLKITMEQTSNLQPNIFTALSSLFKQSQTQNPNNIKHPKTKFDKSKNVLANLRKLAEEKQRLENKFFENNNKKPTTEAQDNKILSFTSPLFKPKPKLKPDSIIISDDDEPKMQYQPQKIKDSTQKIEYIKPQKPKDMILENHQKTDNTNKLQRTQQSLFSRPKQLNKSREPKSIEGTTFPKEIPRIEVINVAPKHQQIAVQTESKDIQQEVVKMTKVDFLILIPLQIEKETATQDVTQILPLESSSKGVSTNIRTQLKKSNHNSTCIDYDRKKKYHELEKDNSSVKIEDQAEPSSFIQRRMNLQKIDLGVMSIDEVVEQAFLHKLVSQELYTEFLTFSTPERHIEFIDLFKEDQLSQWNFKEIKFTLLDHRRLSEWLARLFPKKYSVGCPLSLNPQIQLFLNNVYSLSQSEYEKILSVVDQESMITFWNNLRIKFKRVKKIDKPKQIDSSEFVSKLIKKEEELKKTLDSKEKLQPQSDEKEKLKKPSSDKKEDLKKHFSEKREELKRSFSDRKYVTIFNYEMDIPQKRKII